MKFTRPLLIIFSIIGAMLAGWLFLKNGKGLGHGANSRAEWPEFRGPTQDGQSNATGLPFEWGPEKNVAWKTPLPGRAWSSPIVAGNRIYLTNSVSTDDNHDGNILNDKTSLRVLALDATEGRIVWDREVFTVETPSAAGVHDKNSHASATPVFDQDRIYAHFGHFGTACLDSQGTVIWKTTELSYKPEHGNGGCPVVVDDLLIFLADASDEPFIVALDKATGRVRWKTPRKRKAKNPYSFSTPLVINVNGAKQLICPGSNIVSALNPEDGKEVWHVLYKGYSVVPRPIFSHGLLYMSTGFDRASLLAIRPDGKGDVTDTHVAWQMDKNVPLTPSMLVVNEDFYMVSDNGLVSCLDAKTGTIHWQERVGKATSASLLHADGRIYLQDEFGKGYVIKPGHKLEIIATNDLAEKSLASYAIHGKQILIRTEHALWCIGK